METKFLSSVFVVAMILLVPKKLLNGQPAAPELLTTGSPLMTPPPTIALITQPANLGWMPSFSSDFKVPSFPTAPDPMLGNPMPLIDVETLRSQCSHISFKNRCPPNNNLPNPIYYVFFMDSLDDVIAVSETVSVSMVMVLQWNVTTCNAETTAPGVDIEERVLVQKVFFDDIWRPFVYFQSSADDTQMQDDKIADEMEIIYRPTKPNRTLEFFWTRRGPLTASCSLDLAKFPFDVQNCTFEFALKESIKYVFFRDIAFYEPELPENSQWKLLHSSFYITQEGYDSDVVLGRQSVSRARFSIKIERKPQYFLYSLVTPVWVIMILLLATFLLENTTAERATFAITIMLVLYVIQSDFLSTMPPIPVRILMADYLFFLVIFSGACTLQSMIMFWLTVAVLPPPEDDDEKTDGEAETNGNNGGKNKLLKLCRGHLKISLLRIIDFFCFVIATVVYVIVTVAAFGACIAI